MGAVGPQGEQKLEQPFIRRLALGVTGAAELGADLVELAGPESYDRGATAVVLRRISRPLRPVVATADKPPPGQLVFLRRQKSVAETP